MSASYRPTPNMGASTPTLDLLHSPGSPGDHLFHDSVDCAFGTGITPESPAVPQHPRRCNWCTEHDHPTP